MTKPVSQMETVDINNWKEILDAISDGVWEVDTTTETITFSKKWYQVFGYGVGEMTSALWMSKIHPEDIPNVTKALGDYLIGKTDAYTCELRFQTHDGTYRWLLSRGVAVTRDEEGKPLRIVGTHADIHERKSTEERNLAAARLLTKLIDNLPGGIIVTDEIGKTIYANQIYCDLYGIYRHPDELIGFPIEDGLTQRKEYFKYPETFYEQSKKLIANKQTVLNEEWELKDGRVFLRDYIPLVLGDETKGEIWHLRDVTEQKNTEKRFEKQRVFYEQILNSIAADIVVINKNRRYMFINPHAIKDDALRKWIIGKNDEEFCTYVNRPLSIADNRKAMFFKARDEKRELQWEEQYTNPDGTVKSHMRNMFPVFDANGELEMIIGYGLEITEQVKAREALKTSIETFSSAFNYSGIGMALVSPEGKWLDVNNVLCDMTGYNKEELLQRTFHDFTYPEDVELDINLIRRMLKKEIMTYNVDKRYVSKANKIVIVSLTVSLVWNNDGTPKFFIAQVVDVTKKKELEAELTKKNTDLEITRVNLVNKINQLEELSHIIAHNLRGPAGNIKMLAEGLTHGIGHSQGMVNEVFTKDEALQLITENSVSLMNNLDVLMDVAQIKLNKDIPYNECNISNVIQDVINQLHGNIYEKRAAIRQCIEVKYISYPKIYLESIVYNLLSNALKYNKPNVPPDISITTKKVNDRVVLTVQDNGMGIDLEKYKSKVFKLNQIFHPGYDSKGIGLYITKTQVESLGGSIELKSKPNEGSEFIVTL